VNLDVFAWKPSDMKGIPREVAEHKLNIKPGSKPVKQRLRRFNDGKCKAIGEEILKLLSVGFIREVFHPEWLANYILVKKKNKKWRMCVDYMLTDKRRIHLRFASVLTYTFFTTGFPRFLSIYGARGLQVFDLPLLTSYSYPNYD
jgi:hypothetical protein